MSTVAQWLSTLVLVGAAIAVLIKAGRAVAVFFARIGQFFDDWFGEPERPGIAPARPGVLARIARLETLAESVEHEVKPNNGISMKDQIGRIEEHTVPAEARPETKPSPD